MRIYPVFALIFILTGCSGGGSLGNLNPLNWFKNTKNTAQSGSALTLAPHNGYTVIADSRPLIDQITGLSIDKTASGVIVRATGLAPGQGYHSADLILVSAISGELAYEFRARAPGTVLAIGPVHLREIVAGIHLSQSQLRGVRRIRVIAVQNSRTARP